MILSKSNLKVKIVQSVNCLKTQRGRNVSLQEQTQVSVSQNI